MRAETHLLLLAGGSSERFGERDKLRAELAGRPATEWLFLTVARLEREFESITLVADDEADAELLESARELFRVNGVAGPGETRADSVLNGLRAIEGGGIVLIHDCARPLASAELFRRVLSAEPEGVGVIPVISCSDSLTVVSNGEADMYLRRSAVRRVQTPQRFPLEPLHDAFFQEEGDFSDEGNRWVEAGGRLLTVEGERSNLKLTWPEDLALAESLIEQRQEE